MESTCVVQRCENSQPPAVLRGLQGLMGVDLFKLVTEHSRPSYPSLSRLSRGKIRVYSTPFGGSRVFEANSEGEGREG